MYAVRRVTFNPFFMSYKEGEIVHLSKTRKSARMHAEAFLMVEKAKDIDTDVEFFVEKV